MTKSKNAVNINTDYYINLKLALRDIDSFLYRNFKGRVYRSVLKLIDRFLIDDVLERTLGNKYQAARILGINRNTLHSKIKKLGINVSCKKEYWKEGTE